MKNWIENPKILNTDTELQRLINLEWGVDPQAWVRLAAVGLWDCMPVGRVLPESDSSWQRSQLLVVRLVPDRPIERCPLALGCEEYGESSIIADHREELLPTYLFERLYLDEGGRAEAILERPDAEWRVLCEAWGCEFDRAARIRGSLSDVELRRSLAGIEGYEGRTDKTTAFLGWCAGQPREALAKYVEAGKTKRPWEAPDLVGAGAWREPLLLFASTQVRGRLSEQTLQRNQLDALQVPMPHEAAYMAPDLIIGPCAGTAWRSYSLHHKIASKIQTAVDAGAYQEELQGAQGPLIRAALAFASAGPMRYDGQAHVDAASELAYVGDMPGSLSALLTAISWQRARWGAPIRSSLHAWIQGTADAGPAYALHHELARQHLEMIETVERMTGKSILR